MLLALTSSPVPLYALIAYVIFILCRYLYRLSPLHPLAKYPTPSRLASLSQWYEFYWNVIHDGQFLFRIEKWHKKYGPVIRIGPNELHINDPDFYSIAYAPNYKFSNYRPHYNFVGTSEASMGIVSNAIHKNRRIVLNPLFSKANIQKLDGNIRNHVKKFASIVSRRAWEDKEKGIYLGRLFRCLTIDIISEYAYSVSFNSLDGDPDAPFFLGMRNMLRRVWFFTFFWPLQSFFQSLPYDIIKMIAPSDIRGIIDVQKLCLDQVDEFRRDPTKASAKTTHTTIFQTLLQGNDAKSFIRLSRNALLGEAWSLVAGGTESTAATLTSAVFEACLNVSIQERLHEELVRAFPDLTVDNMTFANCEKLPYLVRYFLTNSSLQYGKLIMDGHSQTAFIKEILRAAVGVPGHLPRIVPKGGTTAAGMFIPEGATVSMSIYLMHYNSDIYTDPEKFDPERWLSTNSASFEEKYLVPFSGGSRSCYGRNLAYAELYMTIASLFRRFRFSLHQDNMLSHYFADNYVRNSRADLVVSVEEY
ncbi:hypothetical protein ABW21_db0205195 [Orbilia brochopaga]|nr:hypothetical protein ABW21_db0205195 [Drechslerella brochopaga]